MNALHGLIALGIVHHSSKGWRIDGDQTLPASIAAGFNLSARDPRAYPALLGDARAAVAWLVRAAWLTPNLGWSIVRPQDLSHDIDLDSLFPDVDAPLSLGTREAALMRVVEAAEQAEDWVKHPGEDDSLDHTAVLARRYLVALGYTGYRSVREIARTKSWLSISYAPSSESMPSGVWLLKPVGAPISAPDLAAAKQEARNVGSPTWGVTNALLLRGVQGGHSFDLDFRAVARKADMFEQLVQLAADPTDFALIADRQQDDSDD